MFNLLTMNPNLKWKTLFILAVILFCIYNLKWKTLFILAVILFCIYFLFGYPTFPTSLAQVKDNFGKQIKLGR